MNARKYRVDLHLSPFDFPPISGLGSQSDFTQTERPYISENKVVLKITRSFVLTELDNNKSHEVLKVQSVYGIPVNEIKTKEDIYEFFQDATSALSEAYQYVQRQMPGLPDLSFPTQPMKTYESEIGGVLYLLSAQN